MVDRLPDNEIRDITKMLEAGKPLDDKYRYLLFKESRQVELLWNGKTTKTSNIVLPFQSISKLGLATQMNIEIKNYRNFIKYLA